MGAADEVKKRIDIVEFISGYTPLKKAGRTYKGLCPFHAEKTPSFVVFPDTQTWHCFGACGTGGDLFTFFMQREGLDFSEALRELAQRAGVSLAPPTSETQAADRQREKFLDIHTAAAQYFHHLLRQSKEGAVARDYLAGRGINAETIERFQLGYALDAWEGLKSHLTGRGYTQDDLVAAGLLVKKEETGSTYDRFRNRLIIPIRDAQGRVIAFGARALNPNDIPKYLNSPQTPLFDKGETLFGLDMAKKAIRDADRAVIVEGYMDVLSAHQHGNANVVAGMGTALTEAQLKLLKRFTKSFVLALDADTAGDTATLRGINLAREALDRQAVPVPTAQGLIRFEGRLDAEIRIATLPPGRDPDDILRETPELWPAIITSALPVVDFYLHVVSTQYDLTSARGKSELVREVLPLLKEIGDPVERAHYVGQLARLVKVEERLLMAELGDGPKSPASSPRPPVAPAGRAQRPLGGPKHTLAREEYLLAIILGQPGALAAANEELAGLDMALLSADDFQDAENRQVFLMLSDWAARRNSPPESQPAPAASRPAGQGERAAEPEQAAAQALEPGDAPQVDGLIQQADALLQPQLGLLRAGWDALPPTPPEALGKDLVSGVLNLRDRHLKQEIANLRFLQRDAEENHDEEQHLYFQTLANTAKEKLRLVQAAMNRRSMMGQRRAEGERFGAVNM
jgi:DNA primase